MNKLDVVDVWCEGPEGLVRYAVVDKLSRSFKASDSLQIGGVVILQAAIGLEQSRLQVRLDDELVDVKWGIRSPLMAERYPESPNCESARFLVEFAVPDAITEMAFELVDDGTGVISPVFKLQTDVAIYDRKFYARQQEGCLRSAHI